MSTMLTTTTTNTMRKRRPSFMQHLPPLDSPTPTSAETITNPKIIGRGGLTLATPISEVKFFRRTSDQIANKYSPQAQGLSIRSIGDLTHISKSYIYNRKY